MDSDIHEFQVRAARNEALFREVNEQVEQLSERLGVEEDLQFVCECAAATCAVLLSLSRREYEEVRAAPNRFLVFPDHHYADVELVVAKTDRFWTVEKIEAASKIATELAPR
jgi:5-bromo-4-chloroindolyl phosphate hydrolysis protein